MAANAKGALAKSAIAKAAIAKAAITKAGNAKGALAKSAIAKADKLRNVFYCLQKHASLIRHKHSVGNEILKYYDR